MSSNSARVTTDGIEVERECILLAQIREVYEIGFEDDRIWIELVVEREADIEGNGESCHRADQTSIGARLFCAVNFGYGGTHDDRELDQIPDVGKVGACSMVLSHRAYEEPSLGKGLQAQEW